VYKKGVRTMKNIYGYCRISTTKQSIARQRENIKNSYPTAVIFEEAFTATTIDRPVFNKLLKLVKADDTIVFDEVSRMSRNAKEGFELYKELYEKHINLVFLKESTLNTSNFKSTQQIATTGNEIADMYIDTTNRVLMILAEQQIKAAFETAQHEVDFLHKRTSEGLAVAKANGKQVGRSKGQTFETNKSKAAKQQILRLSKDFNGTNSDIEVIDIIKVQRNTYYKYKKELKSEITSTIKGQKVIYEYVK
jgi:DNA invertase Pin-like site-specific DNA recombinase